MTIRKRLARSNLIMILIPVAIAAALLLLGGGLAVLLLKRVYLPRLGLSMAALHETGEQLEAAFEGAKTIAAIYGGTVILSFLSSSDAAEIQAFLQKTVYSHSQRTLEVPVTGNPADIPQEPQFDAFESAVQPPSGTGSNAEDPPERSSP